MMIPTTADRPTLKIAIIPMLAAALTLAACGQQPTQAPPEPEPDITGQPEPEPSQSIIREGFDDPADSLPPDPLQVTIGFGDGGSDLSDAALAQLTTVLQSDQLKQDWPIILRGHSDAGGNDAINMRVSQQRAQAVADALVEDGVDEGRIAVIAFGEQNPLQPNALPDGSPNEEGRAANRRVEVTLAPDGWSPGAEGDGESAAPSEPG